MTMVLFMAPGPPRRSRWSLGIRGSGGNSHNFIIKEDLFFCKDNNSINWAFPGNPHELMNNAG